MYIPLQQRVTDDIHDGWRGRINWKGRYSMYWKAKVQMGK